MFRDLFRITVYFLLMLSVSGLRKGTHCRSHPILHQETLDDAKANVEEATGLRPTSEELLKGVEASALHLALKITCVAYRQAG